MMHISYRTMSSKLSNLQNIFFWRCYTIKIRVRSVDALKFTADFEVRYDDVRNLKYIIYFTFLFQELKLVDQLLITSSSHAPSERKSRLQIHVSIYSTTFHQSTSSLIYTSHTTRHSVTRQKHKRAVFCHLTTLRKHTYFLKERMTTTKNWETSLWTCVFTLFLFNFFCLCSCDICWDLMHDDVTRRRLMMK